MSKSFIHQHIKNIKKQMDSSASSVPVKTTPITPIIVNQDNITSPSLTVVIKEISRIKEAQQAALKIEEDRLAKEREAAEHERIKKAEEHQRQEEARLLCEAEERRLLELERERVEQARRLEEERIIREQLAAQKLEEQRLAILEQQRLFRESQERLAREREEQRIRLELEQRLIREAEEQTIRLEQARIAREAEERLELERQRLEQQRIAREIEERARLEQERLIQEQEALQLLQPVQILVPEIPVELPVLELPHLEEVQPDIVLAAQEIHQDIQEPLEPIAIDHVEPEPLHPIAEVQVNEQEVINNQEILEQPLQEEPQPQLLPPLHVEEQPAEIIVAAPLEQEQVEHLQEEIIEPVIIPVQPEVIPPVEVPAEVQHIEEHHQEPEIPEAQEPLAPIAQRLIVQVQGGGEESDFEDLDYVSDFSDLPDAEEGEYVMVGLAGEHQEL